MEKIAGRYVKAMAKSYGAVAVGIATTETLAGGPPSTDLTVCTAGGQICGNVSVALDQDYMDLWFNKRSHADHSRTIRTNVMASGISLEIANYLAERLCCPSRWHPMPPTDRKTPNGRFDEKPHHLTPLPGRTVRRGILGLSGNVLTADNGAGVILGSVVTAAELIPTDPIPESEHYCDDCQLCAASCASGFIDGKEK